MAKLNKETSHEMGLHEEQLKGRTQQRFFSVDETENLTYFTHLMLIRLRVHRLMRLR